MSDLLSYFERGLIPGPEESAEEFYLRAAKAVSLDHPEWKDTPQKFGFKVDLVPLNYSSKKMRVCEGAVTWISDDHVPTIQLHPRFKKGSFLGYQLQDVLAHEAVHAARVRFNEPQFEEVLAYATAPQAWKRFLGPIFTSTWQPVILLLSFLAGLFKPVIPLFILGLGIGWLVYRQRVFKKCLRKFSLSFVLCLTDKEMRRFATEPREKIQAYLEGQNSLRHQLLKSLFKS